MPVINIRQHNVPEGAVVIMRPSKWGNPYKIGPGMNRQQAIEAYRQDLWHRIKRGEVSREELADLHGRVLVCCCVPQDCHGHVLERAAAWAANS